MPKRIPTGKPLDIKAVVDFDRHLRTEGINNTVPLLAKVFGATKLRINKALEHHQHVVDAQRKREQEGGSRTEKE